MQGERGIFLSWLIGVNAIAISLAAIVLVVNRDIQSSLGIQQD